MNKVQWIPNWSKPAPDQVRREELSSIFSDLNPVLPNGRMKIKLISIKNRSVQPRIHQFPNLENGHSLIVEFNDPEPGSADYYIQLVITSRFSETNPELRPTTSIEENSPNKNIITRSQIRFSETSQVTVGNHFAVGIVVDDITNLAGWSLNLSYDARIISLESIDEVNELKKRGIETFFQKGSIDKAKGSITGLSSVFLVKGEVNYSGILATCNFKAIGEGESFLHLKNVKFGGPTGNEIPIEVVNTTIMVSSVPPCDVNANGTVDIFDLILVAQVFGQEVDTRANTNDDGVANIFDLIVVAQCFGQGAAPAIVQQPIAMFSMVENWIHLAEQASDGSNEFSQGISVLREILQSLKPEETVLMANYPNPFNPETWIPYHLGQDSEVVINIYDTTGKIVRTLNMGFQSFGYYASRDKSAYWDGKTDTGEQVSSGTYFYQIEAGEYTETKKMVILK